MNRQYRPAILAGVLILLGFALTIVILGPEPTTTEVTND